MGSGPALDREGDVRLRTKLVAGLAIAVAAVPAVALGAAGSSRSAHAEGVVVYAGPNLLAAPAGVSKQADALFFYPKVATVHVGDSVTFQFRGFHTVTFPGAHRPYPFIVPVGGKQPAVKDAAGNPFWWGGAAPILGVSPLSLSPQGNGTISSPSEVRSSGLARIFAAAPKAPPAPYVLRFTRAGTYKYECAVHPGMRGIVRVLPSTASIPSPQSQARQAAIELQHTLADAKRLNRSKPSTKLKVFVGVGTNATGAEITSFFPSRLVAHVGETVTFRNADQTDIHTVTFGPEKLLANIEKTFVAPHGRQILLNPLGGFASEPPRSPTPSYDGTNHGNGYLNAGLLAPRGAPAAAGPQTYRVTFTKAGTYRYECVIHEHMDGTILVR
jgi:plastocyanin